ncbi:hypothetical protein BKA66DRAFT_595324 [Pyrenochaeta sp. MPI-SDFR-AT-0127]|nr:hypothetical protein BKA66DRAFT_595324 [Pyrenochaeta sp. MPI-SDFR-AT-0127]
MALLKNRLAAQEQYIKQHVMNPCVATWELELGNTQLPEIFQILRSCHGVLYQQHGAHASLYDRLGSRLENARLGGGYKVFMCFALAHVIERGVQGAARIWVDGMVRGWVSDREGTGHWAGCYRPNVGKALLQYCVENNYTIIVEYTQTRTLTTSDEEGSLTTQAETQTTQAAVVIVEAERKGVDKSNRIAMGRGLGLFLQCIKRVRS